MMLRRQGSWLRLIGRALCTSAALLLVASCVVRAQVVNPVQEAQRNATPAATGPLDTVRSWLGGNPPESEFLPPDQAYQLSVRAKDKATLVALLTPAKDYYLYRDRIKFNVEDPPGLAVASVSLPPGEFKDDPNFGRTEVYRGTTEVLIHLSPADTRSESIRLHASYQGCNEPRGVCYPPIEKALTIALAGNTSVADSSTTPAIATTATASPRADRGGALSEPGRIRQLFSRSSPWALMAAFFGFGVLLAFTPCMLPMLPILTGIIVGQGAHPTKRRAIGLSAVYVLGMAITYAAAGVAAGLAGSLLSGYLQNPWVLSAFAAIFVLLALSMFGLYELQLPVSLQTALTNISGRTPGGKTVGVFLMGVLSALIVGPCVAAPLAGALLYIGQTRDAVLGATALFSMAIGMGAPLLLAGAATGSLVRRAGEWTVTVRRLFGVAMLAVAIYLLAPVLPLVVQQLLWAALLIVSAVFARATDPLPLGAPGHLRLGKGIGVIGLVVGVALLLGALSGSRELLQPLAGLRGAPEQARSAATFEPVTNVADLDARLQSARGRYVMLDFWAEWCIACKEMDRFTFSDAQVQARLKDVLLLRADVTANNPDHQALLRRFALFGPPGIVFFDKQGRELEFRVIGFEAPQKFLASLDRAWTANPP